MGAWERGGRKEEGEEGQKGLIQRLDMRSCDHGKQCVSVCPSVIKCVSVKLISMMTILTVENILRIKNVDFKWITGVSGSVGCPTQPGIGLRISKVELLHGGEHPVGTAK